MITIVAKADGFRRCGVVFSATPTEFADNAFTAEQWAVLQAEPMLILAPAPSRAGLEPAPTGDIANGSVGAGSKPALLEPTHDSKPAPKRDRKK